VPEIGSGRRTVPRYTHRNLPRTFFHRRPICRHACGSDLAAPAYRLSVRLVLLDGKQIDLRQSREPKNPRRCWRYVENAATHERTTIIDGDDH